MVIVQLIKNLSKKTFSRQKLNNIVLKIVLIKLRYPEPYRTFVKTLNDPSQSHFFIYFLKVL